MGRSVRIHFPLQQDEDGYPPVAVESVWAQPSTQAREYVLDNVPFFARDATIGDTVLIREEDGNLWFEKLMYRSGNSLVRVVFFDPDVVKVVSDRLVSMGCDVEYLQDHELLAVSIPASTALSEVQGYLQAEATTGTIDYEEPILRQ